MLQTLALTSFHIHIHHLSGFTPALVSWGVLSLHRTGPTGQEVLHVHRHCLGEVGHAPEAATGGAVVQQPAHSGGRVSLQDVLLCSQVPLEEKERSKSCIN